MSEPTRSALLKGVPERRAISEFEVRDGANGLLKFRGYAAVFDQWYEVNDWMGSYDESVERGALKRTLSRKPDVVLNINHDGLPLARTTAGTLKVGTDDHGYEVEADLEPRDPDVDRVRYKLERGDMSDMSWAFRVTVDEWTVLDDGREQRVIKEVNVDGGDVSIVTTGANRNTTADLRSMLAAFTDLDALVESRSTLDQDVIVTVRENLGRLVDPAPRKTMSIRAAERVLELD